MASPVAAVTGVRITGPGVEPLTEVAYRAARRGGGTETVRLTVGTLAVDASPDGCDGVLVTGDLQGVAPSPHGGPPVLLGVALAGNHDVVTTGDLGPSMTLLDGTWVDVGGRRIAGVGSIIGDPDRPGRRALTVCGHMHWDDPVARLGTGHVLNVDARVVVLVPTPLR